MKFVSLQRRMAEALDLSKITHRMMEMEAGKNMTSITVSGTAALSAFQCTVCSMRASDAQDIFRCEKKHAHMDDYFKGTAALSFHGHVRRRKKVNFQCHSPGCDRTAKSRGYCGSHYMRLWQAGGFD